MKNFEKLGQRRRRASRGVIFFSLVVYDPRIAMAIKHFACTGYNCRGGGSPFTPRPLTRSRCSRKELYTTLQGGLGAPQGGTPPPPPPADSLLHLVVIYHPVTSFILSRDLRFSYALAVTPATTNK